MHRTLWFASNITINFSYCLKEKQFSYCTQQANFCKVRSTVHGEKLVKHEYTWSSLRSNRQRSYAIFTDLRRISSLAYSECNAECSIVQEEKNRRTQCNVIK